MAKNQASELAREILEALKEEFQGNKKISGNLLNSTYVIESSNFVEIHIPAPTYDFYEYFINGVITPPKNGGAPMSYADTLDEKGSQITVYWERKDGSIGRKHVNPGNHVGYVDNIINKGIQNWIDKKNLKVKVSKK